MKEAFKAAEVEVIRFDQEDIVTASNCNPGETYDVIGPGCKNEQPG